MEYEAKVTFRRDECEKYREFLMMLTGNGIIVLSKEEIEEIYQETKREDAAVVNTIVLHNDEERSRFGYSMDAFFKDRPYTIIEKGPVGEKPRKEHAL